MAILETIQQPDPNKPKVVQSTSGRIITEPAKERVRVYALDGSYRDVWPVDAREIVSAQPDLFSLTPFEAQPAVTVEVSSELLDEQQLVNGDEDAGPEAGPVAVAERSKDSRHANRRKGRN